ncbi:hypothetical protein GCM10007304_48970 [Rhodococcoides trifolii]|uniref:Uncharacterized protein n=1 Tax=Rhodococcoides trifolii TaxID=908250 RepID=A0A917G8T6_9NOCA|nr:hypothetical protein [Rhodococcus trifolii]GGG29340.1 hypothetical protein GCM10007304_48970 [Rhodococcus trifolii]
MAIELQVRESVLTHTVSEWVQKQLFTMCVPTGTPAITVDHLDVVPGSVVILPSAVGGIDIRLTAAIYTVNAADVLSHSNSVPDGAKVPTGEVHVTVPLAIDGAKLTVGSPSNSVVAPGLPPLVTGLIQTRVGATISPIAGTVLFDCAPIASALEAFLPADPTLGLGDGLVALRFGTAGGTVSQLGAGQEWGIFLDADDAVGLLLRQVPSEFPTKVNAHWKPNGATPAIEADTSYDFEVLGVDVAGIDVNITAGIELVLPRTLRMSAEWDVDLTGLVDFLEDTAEGIVRGLVRRMLPNVDHTGDKSFSYDFELPAIPMFLDARPRWANITSSPAGMTLGGPVQPGAEAPRDVLDARVSAFGKPSAWFNCRARAESGNGSAPTHFDASDPKVRVRGGVTLIDAGAICGAEVLAPNAGLPIKSITTDGVGFDLTIGQAGAITSDVRVIVRTARGVRLVDLGRPVIRRAADGGVDVAVYYVDNCLYLSGVHLKLAIGETLTKEDFEPVPLEVDGWIPALGAGRGLASHLASIDRLDPRELITVRGHGFRVEVEANDNGFAVVPAVVASAETMREVVVERAGRRAFEGTVRVRTVEFTWLAEVGPAEMAAVRDVDGSAYLNRITNGEKLTEAFDPLGEVAFERVGDERVELNPQPLPPIDVPAALRMAEAAGVRDAMGAQFLPGIDDSVALVTTRDGRTLVVSDQGVTGEWGGPTVGMIVDGNFAVAQSGSALHLFSVTRPKDVRLRASRL